MIIRTFADILEHCSCAGDAVSACMIEYETSLGTASREEVVTRMDSIYGVMKASSRRAYEDPSRIDLKISRNDSLAVDELIRSGKAFLDPLLLTAMRGALSCSAVNASMGRIAACPTAGSCGIVPGALTALEEAGMISRADAVTGLFNASGIGLVIAQNATLAGALGGCQAEIGSAAAMAASAVCELMGGSPVQCADAAAISLKSYMGLVCDTVASLVESPCAKRNATGVAVAFASAQMALAGIGSIIPLDEVIAAMGKVAKTIPESLRETSLGGVAVSPTGLKLAGLTP